MSTGAPPRPDPMELQRAGLAAMRERRFAEAERLFGELLAVHPHPSVLNNLGLALAAQGREDEAVPVFEKAIAARPGDVNARVAVSHALLRCGRAGDALARCDEVLALAPGHRDARHNRAVALRALLRLEEARAEFESLLASDPADADAEYSLALVELMLGRFASGWAHYEARWRGGRAQPPLPECALPSWRPGESLAGRAVLVQSEQGLGDTLQFLRFVEQARGACARLDLQVEEPVLALARRHWPGLRVQALGEEPAGGLEVRIPLLSLPLALGIGDPWPADAYLVPDAARVARWREEFPGGQRRVGIAWRGNPKHPQDRQRSIPVERLRPWLDAAGRRGLGVVALQRELTAAERAFLAAYPHVSAPGERLADFEDTAAVMALVDQVACVDTAVAHLAGALGRPTMLLLAHASEWRWGIDRPDGSTYRSLRFLRQAEAGQWEPVLSALTDLLP